MKKIYILFLVLLLSLSASAQFSGGFLAGVNGTQVDGDNYAGYYKLGLNVGMTAYYPLSKKISASMEILFTQKGSQAKPLSPDEESAGYAPIQMRFKLNYVEVPLLLNYRNKTIKNIDKLTLTAGLSIARLLYDTLIVPINPQTLYPGNSIPDVRIIHPFDYSGILGFGYNLTDHWQVQFRFTYSIRQFGASGNSTEINRGLFNNVLTFRMAYIIGGKAPPK